MAEMPVELYMVFFTFVMDLIHHEKNSNLRAASSDEARSEAWVSTLDSSPALFES
jgi:hypothetical protein